MKIREELVHNRPKPFEPGLAGSLSVLGNRLRELGRADEALPHLQRAVDIFRKLKASRDLFKDHLAAGLNNLSLVLGATGRREDALQAAEESVALYNLLAAAAPGVFDVELAPSLQTLAKSLWALGDHEAAQKALIEEAAVRRRIKIRLSDASV